MIRTPIGRQSSLTLIVVLIVATGKFQRLPVPFLNEIDYCFDISVPAGGYGYKFDPPNWLQFFR